MDGKLRVDVGGLNLGRLLAAADTGPEALGEAMEHIRGVAAELTPVETGRLVGSARVHVDGDTASITYDGPYARRQHEDLTYRHEHGQAKFLEQPMITEEPKAIEIIAERIRQSL